MMVNSLLSLSINLHSHKGAYALLIGSGVSRAADIPTGWEITLDLIRKLAKLSGEKCEPNPEDWYKKKYGKDPNYSELLENIAPTQAERNKVLRSYFEPTDEEREEGKKSPTEAHRVIAKLVSDGYLRVIITTNFDRLLERALEDAGVSPAVISTADDAKGALPLVHTDCTIVKVHGDYHDARIKNTPKELQKYDPEIDSLLDRIFDEYGLITVGWSAEWDEALCSALFRCPTRRFTTFFTARENDSVGQKATKLIKDRAARLVEIESSDVFFNALQENLISLGEMQEPHPLSAKLAVTDMKRYLSDGKYKIKLHDLVMRETESAHKILSDKEVFSPRDPQCTPESYQQRLIQYESVIEMLQSIFITGGYWGDIGHADLLKKSLERIAEVDQSNGLNVWLGLMQYPTLLLLYSTGISAIAGKKYDILAKLFYETVTENLGRKNPIILVANRDGVFQNSDTANAMLYPEKTEGKYYTPMSEYLFVKLREPLKAVLPSDKEYELCFDRFEYLFALAYADIREKEYRGTPREWWGPPGRFAYKRDISIIDELSQEIEFQKEKAPLLQAGFLDGSVERFREAKKGIDELIAALHWS